jgi:hypothetical protein
VLDRFEKANLQLQPEKCEFAKQQVKYLGHIISDKSIEASPDKVKVIMNYPVPKSVKEVRSFLGLASFYRRLVTQFALIAKPLTQLTKKDNKFEWDEQCQSAFKELTTDASKIAVAAVLSQVQAPSLC